jgi:uncharacterized short protein YbdD (DUF466 family)
MAIQNNSNFAGRIDNLKETEHDFFRERQKKQRRGRKIRVCG